MASESVPVFVGAEYGRNYGQASKLEREGNDLYMTIDIFKKYEDQLAPIIDRFENSHLYEWTISVFVVKELDEIKPLEEREVNLACLSYVLLILNSENLKLKEV
jgi:hypothetical protein